MKLHKSLLTFTIFSLFSSVIGFFGIGEWVKRSYTSMVDGVARRRCELMYCCEKYWTHEDFTDLQEALQRDIYGQNIMTEILVPALQGHLLPNSPKTKALALSFHGRPGVGKNYVTEFIKGILFHKRFRNSYVNFFTGRLHFPLESEVQKYKVNLQTWITGNVTACAYSLFIFDEVDKMPARVLDAVTPFLDYHETIDGIDYRKSIFIFISNTGGDLIAKEYLKHWKNGRKRLDLHLSDFEDLIRLGAFNEKGGFYRSDTIESSLIDHYIPFLPLEQEHIRRCIHDEFKKRKASPQQSLVKEIINDITFGPEDNPIFSNSGCKRISPKVSAIIERLHFRHSTSHHEF